MRASIARPKLLPLPDVPSSTLPGEIKPRDLADNRRAAITSDLAQTVLELSLENIAPFVRPSFPILPLILGNIALAKKSGGPEIDLQSGLAIVGRRLHESVTRARHRV